MIYDYYYEVQRKLIYGICLFNFKKRVFYVDSFGSCDDFCSIKLALNSNFVLYLWFKTYKIYIKTFKSPKLENLKLQNFKTTKIEISANQLKKI